MLLFLPAEQPSHAPHESTRSLREALHRLSMGQTAQGYGEKRYGELADFYQFPSYDMTHGIIAEKGDTAASTPSPHNKRIEKGIEALIKQSEEDVSQTDGSYVWFFSQSFSPWLERVLPLPGRVLTFLYHSTEVETERRILGNLDTVGVESPAVMEQMQRAHPQHAHRFKLTGLPIAPLNPDAPARPVTRTSPPVCVFLDDHSTLAGHVASQTDIPVVLMTTKKTDSAVLPVTEAEQSPGITLVDGSIPSNRRDIFSRGGVVVSCEPGPRIPWMFSNALSHGFFPVAPDEGSYPYLLKSRSLYPSNRNQRSGQPSESFLVETVLPLIEQQYERACHWNNQGGHPSSWDLDLKPETTDPVKVVERLFNASSSD